MSFPAQLPGQNNAALIPTEESVNSSSSNSTPKAAPSTPKATRVLPVLTTTQRGPGETATQARLQQSLAALSELVVQAGNPENSEPEDEVELKEDPTPSTAAGPVTPKKPVPYSLSLFPTSTPSAAARQGEDSIPATPLSTRTESFPSFAGRGSGSSNTSSPILTRNMSSQSFSRMEGTRTPSDRGTHSPTLRRTGRGRGDSTASSIGVSSTASNTSESPTLSGRLLRKVRTRSSEKLNKLFGLSQNSSSPTLALTSADQPFVPPIPQPADPAAVLYDFCGFLSSKVIEIDALVTLKEVLDGKKRQPDSAILRRQDGLSPDGDPVYLIYTFIDQLANSYERVHNTAEGRLTLERSLAVLRQLLLTASSPKAPLLTAFTKLEEIIQPLLEITNLLMANSPSPSGKSKAIESGQQEETQDLLPKKVIEALQELIEIRISTVQTASLMGPIIERIIFPEKYIDEVSQTRWATIQKYLNEKIENASSFHTVTLPGTKHITDQIRYARHLQENHPTGEPTPEEQQDMVRKVERHSTTQIWQSVALDLIGNKGYSVNIVNLLKDIPFSPIHKPQDFFDLLQLAVSSKTSFKQAWETNAVMKDANKLTANQYQSEGARPLIFEEAEYVREWISGFLASAIEQQHMAQKTEQTKTKILDIANNLGGREIAKQNISERKMNNMIDDAIRENHLLVGRWNQRNKLRRMTSSRELKKNIPTAIEMQSWTRDQWKAKLLADNDNQMPEVTEDEIMNYLFKEDPRTRNEPEPLLPSKSVLDANIESGKRQRAKFEDEGLI